VEYQTKGAIALAEIDELLSEEIPLAPVVADAGYGASTEFCDALTDRGLSYAVGILPDTSVWRPGEEPLPPSSWSGHSVQGGAAGGLPGPPGDGAMASSTIEVRVAV